MRVWDLPPIVAATVTTVNAKTGQSGQVANQAQQFNASTHPRGADGKFITTGGSVEVLGPGGKPIAEGQVSAVLTTPQGPMIQIKNPSTGQVSTLSPSQVQQAPQAIAQLSKPGTQGIPPTPAQAASAARTDARKGLQPRTGVDQYGNKAQPALLAAYMAAYQTEQAVLAKTAANKAKAAANKAKAATTKANAVKKAPNITFHAQAPVAHTPLA